MVRSGPFGSCNRKDVASPRAGNPEDVGHHCVFSKESHPGARSRRGAALIVVVERGGCCLG